jgi:hypothetical protein
LPIVTVTYARTFQDLINSTDDYYGNTTVDDDQYATFTKLSVDTALTTDTSTRKTILNNILLLNTTESLTNAINLHKQDTNLITETFKLSEYAQIIDTILSTDSGTLNNQNYYSEKYVTPGYVGVNVDFT